MGGEGRHGGGGRDGGVMASLFFLLSLVFGR
jgi:hypothetical protein